MLKRLKTKLSPVKRPKTGTSDKPRSGAVVNGAAASSISNNAGGGTLLAVDDPAPTLHATKLQAAWRGNIVRRAKQMEESVTSAKESVVRTTDVAERAVKLQAVWRGNLVRHGGQIQSAAKTGAPGLAGRPGRPPSPSRTGGIAAAASVGHCARICPRCACMRVCAWLPEPAACSRSCASDPCTSSTVSSSRRRAACSSSDLTTTVN